MPTRLDVLYENLQMPGAIEALIGTTEDTDLDCKEWTGDDASKRRMLAKAVCGFANGDGGIVLLGMTAKGRGEEPDLISRPAYFPSPEIVKSKALSILQSDVEPLVQGVRAVALPLDSEGAGVVLISVPSSEGLPHRSKLDWKFYLRSGSSTQNMPLTVLADRFGRRPHAELHAWPSEPRVEILPGYGVLRGRIMDIHVENRGRGAARFPCLLLSRQCDFKPYHQSFVQEYLWPHSSAGTLWESFRGRADDIIYPGETLRICRVFQREANQSNVRYTAEFPTAKLCIATMCDGAALQEFSFDFGPLLHHADHPLG